MGHHEHAAKGKRIPKRPTPPMPSDKEEEGIVGLSISFVVSLEQSPNVATRSWFLTFPGMNDALHIPDNVILVPTQTLF